MADIINKGSDTDRNREGSSRHAWKGTWDRPLNLDEDSLDPLTVARMTDHNVRGRDTEHRDEAPVIPEERKAG